MSGVAVDHLGQPLETGWVFITDITGEIVHAAEMKGNRGQWEFADISDGEYHIFIHNDTWDELLYNLDKPYPGGAVRESSDYLRFEIVNGRCSLKSPLTLALRHIDLFRDISDKSAWIKPDGFQSETNYALGKPVFISPIGRFSEPANLVDGSIASEAGTTMGNVSFSSAGSDLFIVDLQKQVPGDSVIKVFSPRYDASRYSVYIGRNLDNWRIVSEKQSRKGRFVCGADGNLFRYVKVEVFNHLNYKGAVINEIAVYPPDYDWVSREFTLVPGVRESLSDTLPGNEKIIPLVNYNSDNALFRKNEIKSNYAFGRPTTASSSYCEGHYAVDGDPYTGWFASFDEKGRSSLIIDLQQKRLIDTVKVFPDFEAVHGFDIEASLDGIVWRNLIPYERSIGERVFSIDRTEIRYLRYNIDPPPDTRYNLGLREIYVGYSRDSSPARDEHQKGFTPIYVRYEKTGENALHGSRDHGGIALYRKDSLYTLPNPEYFYPLCTDMYQDTFAEIFLMKELPDNEYSVRMLPSIYGGSPYFNFRSSNGICSPNPIVLYLREPGEYQDYLPWQNSSFKGSQRIHDSVPQPAVSSFYDLNHIDESFLLFYLRDGATSDNLFLEIGKFSCLVFQRKSDNNPVNGVRFTVLTDGGFALGGLEDGVYYLELGFPPNSPFAKNYKPMDKKDRVRMRIKNGKCDLGNPSYVSLQRK